MYTYNYMYTYTYRRSRPSSLIVISIIVFIIIIIIVIIISSSNKISISISTIIGIACCVKYYSIVQYSVLCQNTLYCIIISYHVLTEHEEPTRRKNSNTRE